MNYNLCDNFIKFKRYMGYKYNTEVIVMNEIKRFLIDNKVEVINKEIVEKYARFNVNRSSNTIARNMNVFREFCKYLEMQEIKCYQIPNYLYPQKIRQYVPYIFTIEEIKLIFKNIEIVTSKVPYSYKKHKTIPLIIKILYQTGARLNEILDLKINDYDENDASFIIKNSKNDEERKIYLSDKLNEKVLNYHHKFHNNTDDVYFFQITDSKISRTTIENNFYQALKLSNIKRTNKGPRVHDLRHTFIVRNIEKAYKEEKNFNTYLPYLQTYVGHKNIGSLEYYFHLTKPMIENLTPLLEEKLGYLIPRIEDRDYE